MVTLRLRLSSSAPMEAAAKPLPSDDTTPPVTKTNLVRFPFVAIPFPSARPPGASPLQVFRRIHFDALTAGFRHADAKTPFECSQLLQFLRSFQWRRGQARKAQQEVAPVSVQANMFVAQGRLARQVSPVWQRAAREI